MKNVLIVLVAVIVLLPIGGVAQDAQSVNESVTKFSVGATYIGFDYNWFSSKILINITTPKLGRLVYVEEYFTVDSDSNPKPVIFNTYYDDNVEENNISFQILRPLSRSGKFYSMIRAAIIIDDKRMYEKWLKVSSGAHLTFTIGNEDKDIITNINNNIIKSETRYGELVAGLPVVYKFTTPELAVYEVNITSVENNGDTPLRIELLKGISVFPGVRSFPWAVYKYIGISLGTNKIDNASIGYKVENSWLNNRNLSRYDIRLFRWNIEDKKWHVLKTKIINKSNDYVYYQSETTGLSIFVIAELNRTVRNDYINRTVVANMMKVNKSADIDNKIGTLENKNANISEKEKLPVADNKDNHVYIIIGFIGFISSIIAIIISVYVIVRNRKLSRKL